MRSKHSLKFLPFVFPAQGLGHPSGCRCLFKSPHFTCCFGKTRCICHFNASTCSFASRCVEQHELAVTSFIPGVFCEKKVMPNSAFSGPSMKMLQLDDFYLDAVTFFQGISPFRLQKLFRVQSMEDCNLPPASHPPPLEVPWVNLSLSVGLTPPSLLWWRCYTLHTLWCRFEKLTLRHGPASDRSWLSLDKRSFSVHICFTLQSKNCFAFSGKRKKRPAAPQMHNPNQRKQPRRPHPHSHPRRESPQAHTQRRTREFPTLSTSESGQRTSKTLLEHKIQTESFGLNPFPFSLHLSFPFVLPLLWLPCSRSPFLLLFLPHPPASNCRESFLRGAHLHLFWASILWLPTFSSWQGPTAFFLIPETTHLKLFPKPIAFLPGGPIFRLVSCANYVLHG